MGFFSVDNAARPEGSLEDSRKIDDQSSNPWAGRTYNTAGDWPMWKSHFGNKISRERGPPDEPPRVQTMGGYAL